MTRILSLIPYLSIPHLTIFRALHVATLLTFIAPAIAVGLICIMVGWVVEWIRRGGRLRVVVVRVEDRVNDRGRR